MVMRGIKKPGSQTVTIATRGLYRVDADARQELLQWMRRPSRL
jgi:GTP cyclohydrolase I